jgi:hypothetical protein
VVAVTVKYRGKVVARFTPPDAGDQAAQYLLANQPGTLADAVTTGKYEVRDDAGHQLFRPRQKRWKAINAVRAAEAADARQLTIHTP